MAAHLVGVRRLLCASLLCLGTTGCSRESRTLAADQPQTPPVGAADTRTARYQDNLYQIAQGGRYFSWYGCTRCHGEGTTGARNLSDQRWRHGSAMGQVYRMIGYGHGTDYGALIPVEQIWQISAYVRDLPQHQPEKRRRQDADMVGEPQGASWKGPV